MSTVQEKQKKADANTLASELYEIRKINSTLLGSISEMHRTAKSIRSNTTIIGLMAMLYIGIQLLGAVLSIVSRSVP